MLPRSCRALVCFALCLAGVTASAAPYEPESDSVVLETLPFRPTDPLARKLKELRADLQRSPQNVETAVKLARRYYEQVGGDGDPRYLGYAQAALAPWWSLPSPPVEVQVLRASIRQFLHDFDGAVSDLDQVLQKQPQHAQARSLRAVIHIVQARYDRAKADCKALQGGTDLIAIGCEAMVDGLTGKAKEAYATLSAAYANQPEMSPEDRLWVLIRLAELAQRLDRPAVAESYYRQALALDIPDTFLYAAYADLLLDQNRPAEVVTLLGDKTRSDTLLLRLVLAESALKDPSAKQRQATLAARFNAAEMRGDTVHQQEEARFALAMENNPGKALERARENWAVQREPRDARVFLEAAVALNDREAAQPVLEWLKSSGIEDTYLLGLAQRLQEPAK
jgi:hypothetical protein